MLFTNDIIFILIEKSCFNLVERNIKYFSHITDNFTSIQKQAIPMAVVQSGTLGDMHVSKEHKKQDNSSSDVSPFCNEIYQNCPPYLIEQAKIDKKVRMNGSYFNVSESAYNASVAGALDNNKTTVIFNKTIHLLQNITETKYQPDYQPLDQISNRTNKLIYVPPYKNSSALKKEPAENSSLSPISNFQVNKSLEIDPLQIQLNYSETAGTGVNYPLINETTTSSDPLITLLNNTAYNKFTTFINSTNQSLAQGNTNNNLTKRVILTLPHSYYILSSQFDKGISFAC